MRQVDAKVYQLLLQFPTAFEFTSELLLFLAREVLTIRGHIYEPGSFALAAFLFVLWTP